MKCTVHPIVIMDNPNSFVYKPSISFSDSSSGSTDSERKRRHKESKNKLYRRATDNRYVDKSGSGCRTPDKAPILGFGTTRPQESNVGGGDDPRLDNTFKGTCKTIVVPTYNDVGVSKLIDQFKVVVVILLYVCFVYLGLLDHLPRWLQCSISYGLAFAIVEWYDRDYRIVLVNVVQVIVLVIMFVTNALFGMTIYFTNMHPLFCLVSPFVCSYVYRSLNTYGPHKDRIYENIDASITECLTARDEIALKCGFKGTAQLKVYDELFHTSVKQCIGRNMDNTSNQSLLLKRWSEICKQDFDKLDAVTLSNTMIAVVNYTTVWNYRTRSLTRTVGSGMPTLQGA